MTRLTSRFLIDLLIRKTAAAGGFATILAKGDDQSGTILVQCRHRDQDGPLLERRYDRDGLPYWEPTGPDGNQDPQAATSYCARRRASDPDLWLIELDIADAPQFVADWTLLT